MLLQWDFWTATNFFCLFFFSLIPNLKFIYFWFGVLLWTQICRTYVYSWNMFFFVFFKFVIAFCWCLSNLLVGFPICLSNVLLITYWSADHLICGGREPPVYELKAAKRLTVLYKIKKKSNNVCISCVNLKLEQNVCQLDSQLWTSDRWDVSSLVQKHQRLLWSCLHKGHLFLLSSTKTLQSFFSRRCPLQQRSR